MSACGCPVSDSPQPPEGGKATGKRLRVVVPAHNEETVVGELVSDLRQQDYPACSYQIWVLADRCADRTSQVAENAGAQVVERSEGPEGKGALLHWYLAGHPMQDDEALVVLDADNRVGPGFLPTLSHALDKGAQVLQTSVLPSNLDASPIAAAAGLGDWMAREMVYKRKARRGWPVELGGTGLCVTASALAEAGGWTGSFTEDLDLTVRLLMAGHQVEYLPGAKVWDEKPTDLRSAVGQRRRWASGRTEVRRRRGRGLWKTAWGRRSAPMMLMALRLALPGRALQLLIALTLALASVAWAWRLPFSWPVWTGIALWLGGRPLWVLWRQREVRPHLRWYPLTLVWGFVWLWVRIVPSRTGWFHTPHHGGSRRG